MDEEQRGDLARHGHFLVRAPASNRLYRIRTGRAGNIDVVDPAHRHDRSRYIERLCVHPRELVPNGDTMATQKLMIECAEEALRQYANISYADNYNRYDRAPPGLLTGQRLAEIIPIRRAA